MHQSVSFTTEEILEELRLCLLGSSVSREYVSSVGRKKHGQKRDVNGQCRHCNPPKQSRQAGPESVLKHILPEDFWRGPWETKIVVLRNWVISVLSEVVLDR